MEMVSTITSLITNVVNFAGGLLLLFGAVMQISGAFAVGTITQELSGGYMSVHGRLQAAC